MVSGPVSVTSVVGSSDSVPLLVFVSPFLSIITMDGCSPPVGASGFFLPFSQPGSGVGYLLM